jgi:hypothetical protein
VTKGLAVSGADPRHEPGFAAEACCRKDDGELLRRASELSLGFDQAGCFRAAGTGVFKPASRANRSARNRAVFSVVAARAAAYSAIACCPSCSCCSFFLKAASARSRARLASVSNLITPSCRANPLAGQTSLPEGPDAACRCWDAQPSERRSRYFVPHPPTGRPDSFCCTACARCRSAVLEDTPSVQKSASVPPETQIF